MKQMAYYPKRKDIYRSKNKINFCNREIYYKRDYINWSRVKRV